MKHYLELLDAQNRGVFIAAEDVTVIVNTGAGMCSIVCKGVATAIQVKKSHHDVIKQMIEIGVFKLVKFP